MARPLARSRVSYRRDKRLLARLRYARPRNQAPIEDVDYRAGRSLDRALFCRCSLELDPAQADRRRKSWLACALATKPVAMTDRSSTNAFPSFSPISRSLAAIAITPACRGRSAVCNCSSSDDWGLAPLDSAARHDLLEIIEERCGRRSIGRRRARTIDPTASARTGWSPWSVRRAARGRASPSC